MDRLAPARHAGSAGPCLPGGDPPGRQRRPKRGPAALIPLTVPEVRRLLLTLAEPPERFGFRVAWSVFRRRHQATAKRCHAARRARRRAAASANPPAVQVLAAPDLTLTDERWGRVAPLLPPQKPPTGRPAHDHRAILSGMLWVARTGASWRELPARFGPWPTVHCRYQRWRRAGIWQQILDVLAQGDDAHSP